VRNVYEAGARTICTEDCKVTVAARRDGYLLVWSSTFKSEHADFAFGDQEEMGLGLRVAAPLSVTKGNGEIIDSRGRKNERQVWGKQADWCAYQSTIDGRQVGVVLMPSPGNFRPSWFHARDYGLLVANPFGRNAFTKGEKSRVTVEKGRRFQLAFGVLVYDVPADESLDIAAAYREYADRWDTAIGRR
jgi:hypothetical protein